MAGTTNRRLAHSPERVYRKRYEAGLQQGEVAQRVGIVQSHLAGIEKGRWSASPAVLVKIARVLGCEVTDLMPDEGANAA